MSIAQVFIFLIQKGIAAQESLSGCGRICAHILSGIKLHSHTQLLCLALCACYQEQRGMKAGTTFPALHRNVFERFTVPSLHRISVSDFKNFGDCCLFLYYLAQLSPQHGWWFLGAPVVKTANNNNNDNNNKSSPTAAVFQVCETQKEGG